MRAVRTGQCCAALLLCMLLTVAGIDIKLRKLTNGENLEGCPEDCSSGHDMAKGIQENCKNKFSIRMYGTEQEMSSLIIAGFQFGIGLMDGVWPTVLQGGCPLELSDDELAEGEKVPTLTQQFNLDGSCDISSRQDDAEGNLFNCVFFTMDPTGYIDLSEPKAQNSTVTPVDSEEVEYVLTEIYLEPSQGTLKADGYVCLANFLASDNKAQEITQISALLPDCQTPASNALGGSFVGILIATFVFFTLFWVTGLYLFRDRIRKFM